MAVLVSNGNTNLSTTSGFYRAESFNLGGFGTTKISLSTNQSINVTFANAGNSQGLIISLFSSNAAISAAYTVAVRLQQIMGTVTTTVANPTFAFTAHGFSAGQEFELSATTGSFVAGTKYFAGNILTNSFDGFDTSAHAIAGGSTGRITGAAGTPTLYATRAIQTITGLNIQDNSTGFSGTTTFVTPFVFPTPYAVDTSAGKWRFNIIDVVGSGTNHWQLLTSDNTNLMYVAWCDNALTFTSGSDMIVCKDIVTIDMSATFLGQLGTGDTTRSVAAIICKSTTPAVSTVSNLVWQNPASASYTLLFNGFCICSAHGAMRVGTSGSRIAFANKAIIQWKTTPTNGTLPSQYCGYTITNTANQDEYKQGLFLYGEIPAVPVARLTSNAAAGQKNFTTTTSTGWPTGWRLVIPKESAAGAGSIDVTNTIGSISGTSITMVNNLSGVATTNNRIANSPVITLDGYGIKWGPDTTTPNTVATIRTPNNFVLSGVELPYCQFNLALQTNLFTDDPGYTIPYSIDNCVTYRTTTGFLSTLIDIPTQGLNITNVNAVATYIWNSFGNTATNANGFGTASGSFSVTGNIQTNLSTSTPSIAGNGAFKNNEYYQTFNNSVLPAITYGGGNGLFNADIESNYYWGTTGAALFIGTMSNPSLWSGDQFDNNGVGLVFNNTFSVGTLINPKFGTDSINTTDIQFTSGGSPQIVLSNPTFASVPGAFNLSTLAAGAFFEIDNPNGAANTNTINTPTGTFTRDNSTILDSTSSIKLNTYTTKTSTSNEFPKSITFLATNGIAFTVVGNLRYDSAYATGTAGTNYTLPSITITGPSGFTPLTFTAAGSMAGVYQPFVLTGTQSSGIDSLMTITWSAQSNTSTGNAWLDGINFVPLVTANRFYGYVFNPSSLTQVVDTFNVLSQTAALALSGFTINFSTQTLTINGTVSLSNIYDYVKAQLASAANLSQPNSISTADGVSYNTTLNLILGASANITGSGTLTTSGTLTINAASISAPVIKSGSTALTPITISGLVAGSRVQIYNVATSTELYNQVVAGTSVSVNATWTTNQTIRVRAKFTGSTTAYLMYETTGTLTNTGLSITASQVVDTVYAAIGIDGSTVTECSVSGGTIRIYVNDPTNNTIRVQRIYNWYQYILFTSNGIANQSTSYFFALSAVDFRFDPSMKIINQDTVNPLTVTGGNLAPTSGTATIIDNSNGASTVVNPYYIADASNLLANLDIPVSAARNAALI